MGTAHSDILNGAWQYNISRIGDEEKTSNGQNPPPWSDKLVTSMTDLADIHYTVPQNKIYMFARLSLVISDEASCKILH